LPGYTKEKNGRNCQNPLEKANRRLAETKGNIPQTTFAENRELALCFLESVFSSEKGEDKLVNDQNPKWL